MSHIMNPNETEPTILEQTFIDFRCPHCGGDVSFPDTFRSTLQECPSCTQVLIVPKAGVEVGGKLPIPVKTARLALRRLVPGDIGDLLELMTDEESFRFINWEPLEESQVEDWLTRDAQARLTERGGSLHLAIELLETSKLIGFLSLYYVDDLRRQVGLTVFINRGYRGQGFGAEAVRGAADLAFAGLNAHRVSIHCDTRNLAAAKMLEKAKLRREAECRKAEFRKGEWVDTYGYALLEEECSDS